MQRRFPPTVGLSKGVLAPLAIRDFRFLLTSNFFWWQARWMEAIVTGWLVLELTDSAWQVALIAFYRSIPLLVVGIWSGPLIDRVGRRPVIRTAQTVNFVVSVSIALLLWLDALAHWHLIVAALLMGSVWSVDWPARRSLFPDLLGKERTVDGMILENVVQNVSGIFGPFAGGALIAVLGAAGAYTLLAATAGVALVALFGVSRQPIQRSKGKAVPMPWVQMRQGLRYARQNQPVLGTMLVSAIMNGLAFPYLDLLPVFARDVLGVGPLALGVMGSANGMARELGLELIERDLTHYDLWIADECFMTGTAAEVIPVVDIDFRPIGDGPPGRVTGQILEIFRTKAAEQGTRI